MKLSQRGLTTLIVLLAALAIGAIAVTKGFRLPQLETITVETVLTLFAPLTGVVLVLNQFYNSLDAKIADGTLEAGDYGALFSMPTWYAAIVTSLAGVYQFFGGEVISPDVQVLLVDLSLAIVWFMLRSFTERTATNPQTVAQVQATEEQNASSDRFAARSKQL